MARIIEIIEGIIFIFDKKKKKEKKSNVCDNFKFHVIAKCEKFVIFFVLNAGPTRELKLVRVNLS